MQEILKKHSSFSLDKSKEYILSISFRRDGFSFLISEQNTKQTVCAFYKPLASDISEDAYIASCIGFLKNKVFLATYAKTIVIEHSQFNCIIPQLFYNDKHKEELFKVHHFYNNSNTILDYYQKSDTNVVLYSASNLFRQALQIVFNNSTIYLPQIAPFIEFAFNSAKDKKGYSMFLSVQGAYVYITVFKDSKLILSNTFAYSTINDCMYFVMNVFEQLSLPIKETNVYAEGTILGNDTYTEALKMFVPHIEFPSNVDNNSVLSKNILPLFIEHLHVQLCE